MPRPPSTDPAPTDWNVVAQRIRARREAVGLSRIALGELVGASANYVAQVEGGLPISEGKLAAYAGALGVSLPFLRYGVTTAIDVEAARQEGYEAGRRDALGELASWMAQASSGQPTIPGQYQFTLRRVGEEELEAAEREVASSLPRVVKKKDVKVRRPRRKEA